MFMSFSAMKRIIVTLGVSLMLPALTLSVASGTEKALPTVTGSAPLSYLDCEGNACAQVTLTFDEAKQQYKVQNNSNQVVRVEASDSAGGRSILVEAGKSNHLPMKSFIGAYRAFYE